MKDLKVFGFYLVLLLTTLVFAKDSSAVLSCSIESVDTCTDPGETIVFKMSSTSNAHAQLPAQTGYNYAVCCSGVDSLDNSCSAPNNLAVLRLSSPTNAHAQQNTYTTYQNPVCLSAPTGTGLACNYVRGSCAEGYACLASISSETNAHVGSCSSLYPIKVCCQVASDYDFEIRAASAITTSVGQDVELKVDIHNKGRLADSYTSSITADNPNGLYVTNPTATTGGVNPDDITSVSSLLTPLTSESNEVTVTVTSVNRPALSRTLTIPVRSELYSLPEFGLFGFIQIIAMAGVIYFWVINRKVK
ncbi:MAG: hypothetical protein HYW24_04485 [Candidatus Aenigmarchaeota archaeon]|nr:hypothetical protein [Candidatus Aenigmarchaeota archaeon]